ncbi:uncharacterized protein LOC143275333 [Babylonia areolata]|uniref:uncharacterized protein LOC143275333 n=1 Tax=Babylonia areolata TaxID=304850 RepID=UPI003FD1FF15
MNPQAAGGWERTNVDVEEDSTNCLLRYWYTMEENDVLSWEIVDMPDGDNVIQFRVTRQGQAAAVWGHDSKRIPGALNLRDNLENPHPRPIPYPGKDYCEVKLKKKANIDLEQYFKHQSR